MRKNESESVQQTKEVAISVRVAGSIWANALADMFQKIIDILHGPAPGFIQPEPHTMRYAGVEVKKKEFITHTTLHYKQSAVVTMALWQRLMVGFLVATIVISGYFNWHLTLVGIFSFIVILYFVDLLFQTVLIIRSLITQPEVVVTEEDIAALTKNDYATFTVLCPLYKEVAILEQFTTAMSRLDYPKNKLEVLLLLEEDDRETYEAAKRLGLPSFFKILHVPNSLPRTKPKALNWGLSHAKGEFIVIYDAEDIPETDQLKKALVAFKKSGRSVYCFQAKLNFYNPHQNLLTRLFTAEYSMWFDLILTGLHSLYAPIPLGGTSNFFRTEEVRKIEGWDAFNVCEDCDLGMRLFKQGHRTVLFNTTTYEEANSNLHNWVRQRSHWIKGYIQSFFVHTRAPWGFWKSLSQPHVFTFFMIVGGKTLSIFINPFLWAITISYFVWRATVGSFIESLYPGPIFYIGVFTMVIGNFIYLFNYMLGCAHRGYWHLVKYAYLVPFYWLMMSFAAWKAIYQLVVKPHYWEKTHHGLHLVKQKVI